MQNQISYPRSVNNLMVIYDKFLHNDANVSTVSHRTQEQLDSQETIVITDARGQEIADGPGTQS
jgi:hypothetical protein